MPDKSIYNEDLSRRNFLGAAATAVAGAALPGRLAGAQPVPKALEDRNVVHQRVTFPSGTDTIDGYLARPTAKGRHPGVIVVPGIFGVSEYMRETAAELAQSGFAALAVNYFARMPEMVGIQDFSRLMDDVDKISDRELIGDIEAAIDYLEHQPFVQEGGAGVVGFCMGGKYALLTAARSRQVKAVVAYYGPLVQKHPTHFRPAAPIDVAKKIRAPVQGHYAGGDAGIPVADVRAFEAALHAAGTSEEFFIYAGSPHAFHDYSRPSYRPYPAKQAWERTIAFLRKNLSG